MHQPRDVRTLERELAQLKEQLPAHSIPPSLLERIDELEEEIAAALTAAKAEDAIDSESREKSVLSSADCRSKEN